MDKKQLLIKSLARNFKNHLEGLNDIVQNNPSASIKYKPDGSPVTQLDEELSAYIEKIITTEFKGVSFFSEEKPGTWTFPLLVLDPLDGTKEYIQQRPEWTVSLALLPGPILEGEGWVYNPQTNELFTQDVPTFPFRKKPTFNGEVSRSEWEQGLFSGQPNESFLVKPMGSIAYKLGRLAYQHSDFVVSLRPKNIWDIAGGTLLCKEAGLKFYSQGKEVTAAQKLYAPPLLWCHEELFLSLSKIFP